MTIAELNTHKRVLLMGYGKEGKAAEAFLKKYCPTLEIGIADEKDDPNAFAVQSSYDLAIKTPGVPRTKVKIPYTTTTNIFFANLRNLVPNATTIGVTGSKGKSTTTSLIAWILGKAGKRVKLVGNIGSPALLELLEPSQVDTIFVLELSSYMLEDIQFSPNISVFLNIFPEHLDYHGGMDAYMAAKSKIVAHAQSTDLFIFDPSQQGIEQLVQRAKTKNIPWETHLPFNPEEAQLKGEHNLRNIQAAVTVAHQLGVTNDVIADAVRSFQPLPHRLQFVGEFKGIKFYDDAIATAPEPTMEAIQTLKDVDTIFVGGTDRGLDFTKFAKFLDESPIHNIVFFPDTGARIKSALTRKFTTLETSSMKEAVEFAFAHTERGKICLLSTASPSYTLWKDFEEKGSEFQRWVKEMK